MADQDAVTDALCEARMGRLETRLDGIARDTEETRRGVGKLIQIVSEGNGKPALTVRVDNCADAIDSHLAEHAQTEDRSRQDQRERMKARWALYLAILGWLVTMGLWVASRFVPTA